MAYYDVALLRQDTDFRLRTVACLAQEGDASPEVTAERVAWPVCGAPGFGDAYASALAGGVLNPGADPSVISDAQLLAAVQAALTG